MLMKRFVFLVLVVMVLFSCNRDPLKIDVSGIDLRVSVKHLDVDLLADTMTDLALRVPELEVKYNDFFRLFNYQMIRIGGPDGDDYLEQLAGFVNDTTIRKLVQDVSMTIDTASLTLQLENAFRHYKYYFPEKTIPAFYTCISGFNQSIVVADSLIGISLDKYLGADCSYYSLLGIPAYKRLNMYPQKITSDVCYAWAMAEFPKINQDDNLISHMIYQGKLMYLVDAMLPGVDDSVKMGYTLQQINFCKNSEGAMWTYLAEHQLLFATDRMNVKRFVDVAPFTYAFTNESPGRTGVWIGWQIVRSYMNKNPEVKLSELMHNDDYRSILSASGYLPR